MTAFAKTTTAESSINRMVAEEEENVEDSSLFLFWVGTVRNLRISSEIFGTVLVLKLVGKKPREAGRECKQTCINRRIKNYPSKER